MVDFTYSGTPPNLSQSQPDFDENTQYFVDYVATLGGKIEEWAGAVLQSTTTTSTTSNSIGTGSKTFTVEASKGFVVGMSVRCANSGSNFMDGIVTSYSGTSLVVNITSITGTGTFTSWTIFQSVTSGASLGANKFTALQTLADEVTVASASTLDLTTANSNNIIVSGSVTITSVTMPRGAQIKARFTGTPILTHGASLVLPAGVNYTVTANDIVTFTNQNGVVYAEITRSSGLPVISPTVLNSTNDPTFASTSSTQPTSAQWVNGKLALQPFAKSYSSGEQTITTGGLLTFTHGLGAVPKLYYLNYVCKTAELNYSVNDKPQAYYWSSNSTGVFVTDVNATTITVRFGSGGGISLANKTTGGFANATNANWRLEVTAYA